MVLDLRALGRATRSFRSTWPLLLLAVGCRRGDGGGLWSQGRQYDLVLVVTKRSPLTPERQAAIAPLVDSLTARMAVDSVRRDSVFGTYTTDFTHLGVMVGRAGSGPHVFAGSAASSTVNLELSPDATDAGLHVTGQSTRSGAEGTWNVESGRTEGRFTLRAR